VDAQSELGCPFMCQPPGNEQPFERRFEVHSSHPAGDDRLEGQARRRCDVRGCAAVAGGESEQIRMTIGSVRRHRFIVVNRAAIS